MPSLEHTANTAIDQVIAVLESRTATGTEKVAAINDAAALIRRADARRRAGMGIEEDFAVPQDDTQPR